MMNEIIGITGRIAASKDQAAHYLSSKLDLEVFRISDPLKEIAQRGGLEPNRQNLVRLGTHIAHTQGDEYLAQYILDYAPQAFIVTGLRQLGQLAVFSSTDRFRLVAIDAEPDVRFQRSLRSGKLGEADTLETFIEREARENSPPNIQRVHKCMERADHYVTNNGSLEELHESLDDLLHIRYI